MSNKTSQQTTPTTETAIGSALTAALATAAAADDTTSTNNSTLEVLNDDDHPQPEAHTLNADTNQPKTLLDCFGSVKFIPRLDSQIYPRMARDGVTVLERTRKVCDVILELGNSGNVVTASISKVLKTGAKKAGLRMSFMWNDDTKKSAITAETDDAKAQQFAAKENIIGRFLRYCDDHKIDLTKRRDESVQHAVDAEDMI